jgi:hypothetical protein
MTSLEFKLPDDVEKSPENVRSSTLKDPPAKPSEEEHPEEFSEKDLSPEEEETAVEIVALKADGNQLYTDYPRRPFHYPVRDYQCLRDLVACERPLFDPGGEDCGMIAKTYPNLSDMGSRRSQMASGPPSPSMRNMRYYMRGGALLPATGYFPSLQGMIQGQVTEDIGEALLQCLRQKIFANVDAHWSKLIFKVGILQRTTPFPATSVCGGTSQYLHSLSRR